MSGSTTHWGPSAERILGRAVELGYLGESVSCEVLARFRDTKQAGSFSSWLLQEGHLTVEQVAQIEAEGAEVEANLEPIEAGQRFSGCVIERLLGQGGMGVVYLARRERDDSEVVVKFLAALHTRNPLWRARFLREGLAGSRVKHPNVLQVYAVEVEGSRPHIVMEYVAGQDLEEVLEQRGRLPEEEALRIGRDMALGLAAAHAQGVIHRDVKPGNARLTAEGVVKLLDFGLAKDIIGDDQISVAGLILGTPHYMAPEQWGDHEVDARCDIYSLGATLYHLATGQVPCPGKSGVAICRRTLKAKYARPRQVVPELSEAFELVILRMMSLQPRCRQASAAACATDLERVILGEPVDVPGLVNAAAQRRVPLLPGVSFTIGRDRLCDVPLDSQAVSRHHARIDLEEVGFVLHDLESSYGTYVNGMRINRVRLVDKDVIRLGDLDLAFSDGGLEASARVQEPTKESRLYVRPVPQAVWEVLVEQRDPRVVVSLIEALPEVTLDAKVASARRALRHHWGGGVAEQAGAGFEARLCRQRGVARNALFEITKENLRDDFKAWLNWWDAHRDRYPAQLGSYHPRPCARLRVLKGGESQEVLLGDRLSWSIGRGADCAIRLSGPSVSRHHATILRLHQRFMIRDEGSRFGTEVNGQTLRAAFLEPGHHIRLGERELVFESEDLVENPPRDEEGRLLLDTCLFDALVELEHPAVVAALLRFLTADDGLSWIEAAAARMASGGEATRRFAGAVRAIYDARRELARTLLPRLVPSLAGVGEEGWSAQLESNLPQLPTQAMLEGWFPKRRPSGDSTAS